MYYYDDELHEEVIKTVLQILAYKETSSGAQTG